MAISFRIFPAKGLVYVRYSGFATLDEGFAAFGQYAHHPDFRPGQKQLVDLAEITGMEKDYVKLFALQAKKAEIFMGSGGAQTLIVYHAPTPLSYALAQQVLKSWEPTTAVIPLVQEDEAGALEILGQPERSFHELLQGA